MAIAKAAKAQTLWANKIMLFVERKNRKIITTRHNMGAITKETGFGQSLGWQQHENMHGETIGFEDDWNENYSLTEIQLANAGDET